MSDEIGRAYATLGLEPGAGLARIKKQHRALVRRWHPDRFGADPVGQVEAAQRMSQINQAYRLLLESHPVAAVPPAAGSPPAPASAPGEGNSPRGFPQSPRLTREQIDRIVGSIGSESPVDMLLRSVGSALNRFRFGCMVVALPALIAGMFLDGSQSGRILGFALTASVLAWLAWRLGHNRF